MQFDIPWRLPDDGIFGDDSPLDIASWDYQVYYSCDRCKVESRFDRCFGSLMNSGIYCPFCKTSTDATPVRHEMVLAVSCRDCGFRSEQSTLQLADTKCVKCLSGNVDEQELGFSPAYAKVFGDGFSHTKWGVNVEDDETRLLKELQSYNGDPQQVFHLLTVYRFSDRLRRFSYADNPEAQWKLLNIQGNLMRDYFRRTRVVNAGRSAVLLFERSAAVASHPFARAMIEHNVAMAVYSLLSVFDADTTSLILERPDAKAFALDVAGRARDNYVRTDGFTDRQVHVARIDHLMGDILAVGGNPGDPSLRLAIERYSDALADFPAGSRLALNVRMSRANAIEKLKEKTARDDQVAVEDLKASLIEPDTRIWPERHIPLLQLGTTSARQGDLTEAVRYLEEAAALVLDDARRATSEDYLYPRVRESLRFMSALAWVYALQARPKDVLAAFEALRAETISLQKEPQEKRAKRALAAQNYAMQLMMGQQEKVKLSLPDVREALASIADRYPDSAILTVDLFEGKVTTVLVQASERKRWPIFGGRTEPRISLIHTEISREDAAQFSELFDKLRNALLQPSAFRERRLTRALAILDRIMFAPIRQKLLASNIKDVMVALPGPLYRVPFDLEIRSDGTITASELCVRYIPSVRVAATLLPSNTQQIHRLLIVGYAETDLAAAVDEIDGLTKVWRGPTKVLTGATLSKRTVLFELGQEYDFIHFICHGTFVEEDPQQSALHLVRDARNDAMRVTAEDIAQLRFRSSPVISLSACSSGVASLDPGNDLFGLTGAFIRAGARSIIGSRWPVYDDFASRFMTELYAAFATQPEEPARCFSAIQRDSSLREPLENWAAFSYMGV
ncbi:CHAT domain-containing protein [Rhizobium johnstonii]|uniref:CHAT domain-containing protein n=1 Tax=Rhizobium johnstonii TaxID=3019933 RepID=UPI003F95EA57